MWVRIIHNYQVIKQSFWESKAGSNSQHVYEHYLETQSKYLLIDLFLFEILYAFHYSKHNLNKTSNILQTKMSQSLIYEEFLQINNKKYKKLKSQVTKKKYTLEKMFKVTKKEMQSNNELFFPFQICWKMDRTQVWHGSRKLGIFTHCCQMLWFDTTFPESRVAIWKTILNTHTIQQNNVSSRNLYQAYNKIKNVHKCSLQLFFCLSFLSYEVKQ